MKAGSYSAARMAVVAQVLTTILRYESMTYPQIAAQHGISTASVFRIARHNKVTRKRGRKAKPAV